MKRYCSWPALAVITITLIFAVWLLAVTRPVSPGPEARQTAGPPLPISGGNQIFTNVPADSLQSAAPPARATTETELNPQQTTPNYCNAQETPLIDGCVSH